MIPFFAPNWSNVFPATSVFNSTRKASTTNASQSVPLIHSCWFFFLLFFINSNNVFCQDRSIYFPIFFTFYIYSINSTKDRCRTWWFSDNKSSPMESPCFNWIERLNRKRDQGLSERNGSKKNTYIVYIYVGRGCCCVLGFSFLLCQPGDIVYSNNERKIGSTQRFGSFL